MAEGTEERWNWDRPELRAELRRGTVLETYDCGYIHVEEVTGDGVVSREVFAPHFLWRWDALTRLKCTVYSQPADGEELRPRSDHIVRELGGRIRPGEQPWAPWPDEYNERNVALVKEMIHAAGDGGGELRVRFEPSRDDGPLAITSASLAGDPTNLGALEERLLKIAAELRDYGAECQGLAWSRLDGKVVPEEDGSWRYAFDFGYGD